MTYLISSTNYYKVATVQDALELRKELEQSVAAAGGELVQFGYDTKYIKAKGEILEEFQQVKAKFVFNDIKEPENSVRESYGGIE